MLKRVIIYGVDVTDVIRSDAKSGTDENRTPDVASLNYENAFDESKLDPSLVDSCLSICRECEHSTTEAITASDDPGLLVRAVGNVIGGVMRAFGVKSMRCKKCGCFVNLKSRLLSGSGCPLKKWPNDTNDTSRDTE